MVRSKQSFPTDAGTSSSMSSANEPTKRTQSTKRICTEIIDLDKTDNNFEKIVFIESDNEDVQKRENSRIRKEKLRANLNNTEKQKINEQNREKYHNLSDVEKQRISEQNRGKYQNLSDVEKRRISEQNREKYQNLAGVEKQRISEQNREKYQNLTDIQKNQMTEQNKAKYSLKRGIENLYQRASSDENVEYFELGNFEIECKHCNALHFIGEKPLGSKGSFDEFYDCCNFGKNKKLIEMIDEYPLELKILYSAEDLHHKNYLVDIRKYNNSFACGSLCCNRFNFANPGPSCFKISGQVYHKFNTVAQPINNMLPTNGQLYFYDSDYASDKRINAINDLDPQLIARLEIILRKYYPFAEAYKMMCEIIEEQQSINSMENELEVKMLIGLRKGYDPNRYNIPRINEVAAIMVCDATGEIPPASIVVNSKGTTNLQNIYPLDPIVEPLLYPLLYPFGTRGWHFSLKDSLGKRISLCDFTKFKLFYRRNFFLPHHHSKKLFQQWVVDQCARVEWDRLNYIRHHQKEIKASSYKGLEDFLTNRAEQSGAEIGKQIILPSSFTGGPRNKDQNYVDALAIVGETGKPDLFLTYTCNPDDPDIKKCLFEGQYAIDRPDIVARVFKMKSDQFVKEVVTGGIFGKVIGYVWVIEFQQRGLPHLHMLVTLDPKDKFKNKEKIDKYISAELPLKNKDPELRELVNKFMLHGPCGQGRPDATCMRNGKCRFKFPKKFQEDTILGEDGYAIYKRPNNGEFEYRKGVRLTNQNVASYNPYLLKRFKSHINVEVCSELSAIKYIYKYIYKGFDAAIVECVKEGPNGEQILLKYDEVGQYLDARYLSPVEACYRIFKFELQGKSHSIERLEVHLENEQTIYFEQNANTDLIEESMHRDTKLTAYFKFYKDNPNAPKMKYIEFPKYCTFDQLNRIWKFPRKGHHNVIGRIYSINPKNTELYYLRYLLLHVHATSFEDLRTVNGIIYPTYAQACLALGLSKDDEEWDKCLMEASMFKFPRAFRSLFVNILVNCDPKYPHLLWEKYKDDLCQDLLRIYSINNAYEKGLTLINGLLLKQEKRLDDFENMPQISRQNGTISEDDLFDPKEELEKAGNYFSQMNSDQKNIYKKINSLFEGTSLNNRKCFYIDGPGGTGKSFLLTAIYHLSKGYKKKVCNMAFSGIAATLLKNGRTVHNRFKLPLDLEYNSTSGIEKQTKDSIELIETEVFLWDEAPMSPRFALEIVDRKLKELCDNDEPFGGKILICSGDFRQCMPIKNKANRTELVDLLISKSRLWCEFLVMSLKENMRSDANAREFARELLAIGDGIDDDGYIKIPSICDIGEGDLVEEIFGEIFKNNDFSKLYSHCILSPYNNDVNRYNEEVLAKFPGDSQSFFSIDEAEPKSGVPILPELLNKLDHNSLPKHELRLKINCVTMLIRNINVNEGLCNGTRLQILDINKNVLRCMILTGNRSGEIVFIPRITLIEDRKFPYVLKRHQFPLKLAFCMSINKAQGQTFYRIGIDFSRDVFAHGQTYVALSRGKSWDQIKVKFNHMNSAKTIKNIVWHEVLNY